MEHETGADGEESAGEVVAMVVGDGLVMALVGFYFSRRIGNDD